MVRIHGHFCFSKLEAQSNSRNTTRLSSVNYSFSFPFLYGLDVVMEGRVLWCKRELESVGTDRLLASQVLSPMYSTQHFGYSYHTLIFNSNILKNKT